MQNLLNIYFLGSISDEGVLRAASGFAGSAKNLKLPLKKLFFFAGVEEESLFKSQIPLLEPKVPSSVHYSPCFASICNNGAHLSSFLNNRLICVQMFHILVCIPLISEQEIDI